MIYFINITESNLSEVWTFFNLPLNLKYDLFCKATEYIMIVFFADFFIELDRQCKPLTMHSSIIDLVEYVREGINRLKKES